MSSFNSFRSGVFVLSCIHIHTHTHIVMIDRCIGAADIGQDENNKQLQSAQSHKLSMDCALHSSNVRSVRFDVVIDCHEMLN